MNWMVALIAAAALLAGAVIVLRWIAYLEATSKDRRELRKLEGEIRRVTEEVRVANEAREARLSELPAWSETRPR
jgi:hypothetical protein